MTVRWMPNTADVAFIAPISLDAIQAAALEMYPPHFTPVRCRNRGSRYHAGTYEATARKGNNFYPSMGNLIPTGGRLVIPLKCVGLIYLSPVRAGLGIERRVR